MSQKQEDTEEETTDEENSSSDSDNNIPRKEKLGITNHWKTYRIPKDQKSFFENAQRKWYVCETKANGSCALDAMAIAFGLDRNAETWEKLRFNAAQGEVEVLHREDKLQKNHWLEPNDIIFLAMKAFGIIPIILGNAAYMLLTGSYFAFSLQMLELLPVLQRKTKTLNYIVILYSGSHFETLGALHKHKRKISSKERHRHFRTIFTEKQLPKGFLLAWQADLSKFEAFSLLSGNK